MRGGGSEGKSCRRGGHIVGQPGNWDSEEHTQDKGWPRGLATSSQLCCREEVCFGGSIKNNKPEMEHVLNRTSGGQVRRGQSQRRRVIEALTLFSSMYDIAPLSQSLS